MCALATRKYLPAGESLGEVTAPPQTRSHGMSTVIDCLVPAEALRGAVLFFETSEEFPAEYQVYSFFQSLGGENTRSIPQLDLRGWF